MEYRVYAEDPSRKFLPSIGFLKKYKEPHPHEHIRIDTGVEEGSEISMYYDPMISKLVTWGKDRQAAMNLLATAMDEYVVRGVVHNIGFGRSILRNEAFRNGNYSTAFIPTFYPTGFKGDPLSAEDHFQVALAAFYMKSLNKHYNLFQGENIHSQDKEMYVSLKDETDIDYKVEHVEGSKFTITDCQSGKVKNVDASEFLLEYGALLRFNMDG